MKFTVTTLRLVFLVLSLSFVVMSCGGGAAPIESNQTGASNVLGEGSVSSPVQVTFGSPHSGWIASTVTGGFSYYVYTPTVSGTYTVDLSGVSAGSNVSWSLSTSPSYLSSSASCNSSMTLVPGSIICPTFMSSGTPYYILVANTVYQSGPNVSYTITVDTAAPHAPDSVSLTTPAAGTIQITWNPVAAVGSVYYNLYWATSSQITTGPSTTATKILNVSSPYLMSSLTGSVKYYFVVTAANQYGEGPASQEASATAQ